jgi:hypothetical protein
MASNKFLKSALLRPDLAFQQTWTTKAGLIVESKLKAPEVLQEEP